MSELQIASRLIPLGCCRVLTLGALLLLHLGHQGLDTWARLAPSWPFRLPVPRDHCNLFRACPPRRLYTWPCPRHPGPEKPSDPTKEAAKAQEPRSTHSCVVGANQSSHSLISRKTWSASRRLLPLATRGDASGTPAGTWGLHRSVAAPGAEASAPGGSYKHSPKCEGNSFFAPQPQGRRPWSCAPPGRTRGPGQLLGEEGTAALRAPQARTLPLYGPGTWIPRQQDVRRLALAVRKHEKASAFLFPGRARPSG